MFKYKKVLSVSLYYSILRRDKIFYGWLIGPLLRVVAILVVSVVRFLKDACSLSASALTYYTALSVVPVVALAMGISKGFGIDEMLQEQLTKQSFADPQVLDVLIDFANVTLSNSKSGIVTGIGIVMLFWAVVRVFGNAELTMNRIWGIQQGRSWGRKFADYLSFILIVPVFLIVIGGINIFLTSNLKVWAMEDGFLQYAGPFLLASLKWLPYILIWVLFTFIYMFIPNTKVRFKYALLGGILAGSVFQIVQWFYIKFQIGVSSYNAVYGSLAAIPLMLVWLQLSWSIILWGAEIAYVTCNSHIIYHDELDRNTQWSVHVDQSVRVLRCVSEAYMTRHAPVPMRLIGKTLHMNVNKLRILLDELCEVEILLSLKQDDDVAYMPLIDFHELSMSHLIVKLAGFSEDKEWQRRFVEAIQKEFAKDKFAMN